jgi:hypothetical protein
MAFEEGYMGHEYLARPANTFQPRTQHINQRFPRHRGPQDVYQVRHVPALGEPPRPVGCTDDASMCHWPAHPRSEDLEEF